MSHPYRQSKYTPSTPTRAIPRALRWFILVNGWMGVTWLASIVLALGIVIVIVPAGAPLTDPDYDGTAPGTVVKVDTTGTEINDEPVLAVEARFDDETGTPWTVRSYETSNELPAVGRRVTVHYMRGRPGHAVIEGMRTSVTPWWLKPFLVVLCLGFAPVAPAFGFRRRRRAIELLRHGRLATAKVVGVREDSSGEGKSWTATLELLTDEKRTQRIDASAPKPGFYVVGADEPVVYDPDRPDHVSVPRALPGRPAVDGDIGVRFG